MLIEMVEFYPLREEKGRLEGTVHIYLADHDIDIRGIWACKTIDKNIDKWVFRLPSRKVFDETGKQIEFPVFSFTDRAKMKEIFAFLLKDGKEYIIEKIKEGLTFPKQEKKRKKFSKNFKKKAKDQVVNAT